MEGSIQDPLDSLVADGSLRIRPVAHYEVPTVVTIDLDQLAETLTNKLAAVFQYKLSLISRYYTGSEVTSMNQVTNDAQMMANYLVGQTYNKLRQILKMKHPMMVESRMKTRCPIHADLEFPAWLSSTLSSIGPLCILDGPQDTLVVYATEASKSQYWGRKNPVNFFYGHYERLMTALRAMGVRMAPFDFSVESGSFFPTLSLAQTTHPRVWDIYGQVHQSHYEKEDIARVALVASKTGATTFEPVGMRVGYVDDEATLAALAALPAPPSTPAGQTADSPGRPVGLAYQVNSFGIQPAAGANPRGVYVVGGGMETAFQFVFASEVSTEDMEHILKYRIMRTT